MDRTLAGIIAFIAVAYFWSALLIFTPYYNWQYANENGFTKWLYGGQIEPTLKAFIWPYYVFYETTNSKTSETLEYWVNKSNALWDGHKYTDPKMAIEYLDNAIKLKPDIADTYSARGNAYCDLGQYQRAIEDYSEAIRLKPDLTLAYGGRGLSYFNQGNNNLGCRDAQKACDLGDCTPLKIAKEQGSCR